MPIYKFTFPISNYYDNDVFYQDLYIDCEVCPNTPEVVKVLKKLVDGEHKFAKENPEQGPHTYEFTACLKAVDQMEDGGFLPYLHNNLIQTNKFCKTKFGRKPLTVTKLRLYRVEDGRVITD